MVKLFIFENTGNAESANMEIREIDPSGYKGEF